MISIGLVVNLIFVAFASYIFYRSLHYLHDLLGARSAESNAPRLMRRLAGGSGLLVWFGAGTLMMITGLSGLANKLIIALQ